jgi:hypothetical protein
VTSREDPSEDGVGRGTGSGEANAAHLRREVVQAGARRWLDRRPAYDLLIGVDGFQMTGEAAGHGEAAQGDRLFDIGFAAFQRDLG